VVWQCNHKFDGGKKCATPHLDEETIKQLFIKALNTIGKEKDLIIAGFGEIKDTAFETGELETEARQLNGEMNVAAELIQKCIGENARVAQNQGEYAKRYDALVERFETAKARLEEVQAAITEKQAQRKLMENFMEVLRGLPEQVDYFDEAAWKWYSKLPSSSATISFICLSNSSSSNSSSPRMLAEMRRSLKSA